MRQLALLLVLGALMPALATASEPNEPLSYEDWEISAAGITASEWAPHNADCPPSDSDGVPESTDPMCSAGGLREAPWWSGRVEPTGNLVDAAGNLWTFRRLVARDQINNPLLCLDTERWKTEILRCSTAAACTTIATLTDRCSEGAPNLSSWTDRARVVAMWIDNANGYLYVRYKSFKTSSSGGAHNAVDEEFYGFSYQVMRLEGLPSLFHIFQTYEVDPNQISFEVPAIPEGLEEAEHFDTYWGDLASVGDWTQARALQCDFPSSPPRAGDPLSVADTLPSPLPGRGYYYLTAVNYLGERRFGRRANAGELSGRNPSTLPSCVDMASD